MSALQRLERRLSGMVEGLFARAFKSEVQPVEVAAALQRRLDDEAAVVGRERTLVPNRFLVDLGNHDYDRLAPYEKPLTDELAAMVREHAEDQRYTFVGPVKVELHHAASLDTGVFHVRSEVVAGPEVGPLAVRPERRREPAEAEPGVTVPREAVVTTAMPTGDRTYGRVTVRESKAASYDIELRGPITVIGRGAEADVRLADHAVSRRHAEIKVSDGRATVNDLGSTNGTSVNGARVSTAELADGDEVRLGETVLVFHEPGRG